MPSHTRTRPSSPPEANVAPVGAEGHAVDSAGVASQRLTELLGARRRPRAARCRRRPPRRACGRLDRTRGSRRLAARDRRAARRSARVRARSTTVRGPPTPAEASVRPSGANATVETTSPSASAKLPCGAVLAHVPQPQGAVRAAGGKRASVRAERNAQHRISVTGERIADLLLLGHAPEADGAVEARRRERAAVRGEGDARAPRRRGPLSRPASVPPGTSHSQIEPSTSAAASSPPSGLKAMLSTESRRPSPSSRVGRRVTRSHSRTVRSKPPDASVVPSGLIEIAVTRSSCRPSGSPRTFAARTATTARFRRSSPRRASRRRHTRRR